MSTLLFAIAEIMCYSVPDNYCRGVFMGIGKRIERECINKGLNIRQLALKADVPYSTLYSAIKRDSSGIDMEALKRIAGALDVPWYDLASDDPQERERIFEKAYPPGKLISEESVRKWDERQEKKRQSEMEKQETWEASKAALYNQYMSYMSHLSDETSQRNADYEKFARENEIFRQILEDFRQLNEDGQQVAVERVHELTEIPRYKRKSTPEE